MKKIKYIVYSLGILLVFFISCKKDNSTGNEGVKMQLVQAKAGETVLDIQSVKKNIQVNKTFQVEFSNKLDTSNIRNGILLKDSVNTIVPCNISFSEDFKTAILSPIGILNYVSGYSLNVTSAIKGSLGESFPGVVYKFTTENGVMTLVSATLNGLGFIPPQSGKGINPKQIQVELNFSQALDANHYKENIAISGGVPVTLSLSQDNKKVTITNTGTLGGWKRYYVNVSSSLTAANGFSFNGFSNSFVTAMDTVLKYPKISDDALLDLVEKQTFKFFWDDGHPVSGLSRDRNGSGDVVTSGGSGFGMMTMLVAIERGFITRTEGFDRLQKMVNFLNKPSTDKFHGAFPHWLNGSTGKVIPFSTRDDGGDLVETAFLMQGLLTVRQYFKDGSAAEKAMCDTIQKLWENVEWTWYQKNNENHLYWHWSPNYNWDMNMPILGWDEALIVYVLAASSPTYPISKAVYTEGWARNGAFPMKNGKSFYNVKLPLGEDYGGPLFFAHYSFLGLDPRNLQDSYTNYWEQNVNHATINFKYCVANPKQYIGYSKDLWGLTASDNPWGYNAHSPTNDLGVITPTAALSSMPYTPEQSLDAMRFFYYYLGDRVWGDDGFYDAFDVTEGWYASSFLAIDQGPIICMIENYRTQLLWNLFMSSPEIKPGLDKLGFTY